MSASRLTLIIPGFTLGAGEQVALPPNLRRLIARADWEETGRAPLATLLHRFGYAEDSAVGPLLALHDLDLPSLAGDWLRADPIHLRADAKLVMLLAPTAAELDEAEARELLSSLEAELPEFEWRCGHSPDRWYVRMPFAMTTSPHGPAWLNGRSITPFFPQDAARRRWRQLTNEAQMVLHAATANARREARGVYPLNAVWLWGGGAVSKRSAPQIQIAAGNDVLLAGLARATGVSWHADPDPARLLQEAVGGGALALLGSAYGLADTTLTAPSVAEQAARWADAAWQALRKRKLDELELIGEGVCGRLNPRTCLRFWRGARHCEFGDPHAVRSPT